MDLNRALNDLKHAVPDGKHSASDLKHTTADVKDSASDLKHAAADVKDSAPDLKHAAANVKDSTSYVKHTAPDVKHSAADLKHPAPDLRHATLDGKPAIYALVQYQNVQGIARKMGQILTGIIFTIPGIDIPEGIQGFLGVPVEFLEGNPAIVVEIGCFETVYVICGI